MVNQKFKLETEYIKLDSLIKLLGLVSTGGQAKNIIQNGDVYVNDEVCLMRGKKIRVGDKIKIFSNTIEVI